MSTPTHIITIALIARTKPSTTSPAINPGLVGGGLGEGEVVVVTSVASEVGMVVVVGAAGLEDNGGQSERSRIVDIYANIINCARLIVLTNVC